MNLIATRRAFMNLIGVTTLGGPKALAELPGLLAAPSTLAALAAARSVGVGQTAQAGGPGPPSSIGQLIASRIDRMKRDVGDDLWRREQTRAIGHLDGDLQSMRSISLVNRQRMQRERDYQYVDLMRKAEEMLWGR